MRECMIMHYEMVVNWKNRLEKFYNYDNFQIQDWFRALFKIVLFTFLGKVSWQDLPLIPFFGQITNRSKVHTDGDPNFIGQNQNLYTYEVSLGHLRSDMTRFTSVRLISMENFEFSVRGFMFKIPTEFWSEQKCEKSWNIFQNFKILRLFWD